MRENPPGRHHIHGDFIANWFFENISKSVARIELGVAQFVLFGIFHKISGAKKAKSRSLEIS